MDKRCSRCDLPKEIGEFRKRPENKDGYGNMCSDCRNTRRRTQYQQEKEKIRAQQAAWYRRNKTKVAIDNQIYREDPTHKARMRQQQAEWRRTHKEHIRLQERRRRLERYGLTPDGFDQLLAAQNGMCAICNTTRLGSRNLCIDHNHKTGKIRGLLCVACNMAIGYMKDNPARLKAAADYLSSHGVAQIAADL